MAAKQLLLIRHSYAEDTYGQPDIQRQLSQKGVKIAYSIKELLASFQAPNVVFTSPADRTGQTCNILNELWQLRDEQIEISRPLYYGNKQDYLAIITEIPNQVEVACLVGHNPMISYLALTLYPEFNLGFSPGSVLLLQNEMDNWRGAIKNWKYIHFINSSSL